MSSRKKKEHSDQSTDDTTNSQDSTIRKCWTCDAPLNKCVYVKCVKCPEMDQCIQCFSTAATCEGHGTDHPFVLMDHSPKPIIRVDWSSEQDALLLYGIQMCGVGNWNEIAKVVATKTNRECEQHYIETYIESDTAPLPPNHILPELKTAPPLPYDTNPRESRPSIAHEKNLLLIGKDKATTPAEFAGWMPKRHEFDIEYMNEAEELISDCVFNEKTETIKSFQFKLKQLHSYNVHLKERHRRTELALEWNLLDGQINDLGGQTPEEKQLEQQIMPMAQAIPRAKIMQLADTLHEVKRSQEDMKTLVEWRENGIMTMDEGQIYNRLKEFYEKKKVSDQEVAEWNDQLVRELKEPGFRRATELELLSESETKLIAELKITPLEFIKIKEFMLSEFAYRGKFNKEILDSLMKMPDLTVTKIFEFMEDNGQFFVDSNLLTNENDKND